MIRFTLPPAGPKRCHREPIDLITFDRWFGQKTRCIHRWIYCKFFQLLCWGICQVKTIGPVKSEKRRCVVNQSWDTTLGTKVSLSNEAHWGHGHRHGVPAIWISCLNSLGDTLGHNGEWSTFHGPDRHCAVACFRHSELQCAGGIQTARRFVNQGETRSLADDNQCLSSGKKANFAEFPRPSHASPSALSRTLYYLSATVTLRSTAQRFVTTP